MWEKKGSKQVPVDNNEIYRFNGLNANYNTALSSSNLIDNTDTASIFDFNKEAQETSTCIETGLDLNNIDLDTYNVIEPKEDKALGFLWKKDTYTYTSSSGIKITVDKLTDNMQILEDKETGEVIVIGADGAVIEGSGKNCTVSVINSVIDKINTKKGNDEIRIYNSTVDEIETGKGQDSITIENSTVNKKINTGLGNDFVTVTNSTIEDLNTSSSFLWGLLDNGEDTVILNDTSANKIKTGKGEDTIVTDSSDIETLKTGKGSNSLSLDETDVDNLKTNKKDTIIENDNYNTLNIDVSKVAQINSDVQITIDENGNTIPLNDYVEYMLNQEVGFETIEEYRQYALDSLTSSLKLMQETFDSQNDKDGVMADGYSALKELTGLGISSEDAKNIIAKQNEIIEGLNAAINGESDMTFEQAYKYYLGVEFSTEKIDNYMKLSNTYSALMTASQYDSDYLDKFEDKTGTSIETVAKEYYLAQSEAQGKDSVLSELVNKYADDQNNFADKLSTAISITGMCCIVAGAIVSFIPGGAAIGVPLMTAGKYISLGGMFIDNAVDLVDDTTDKDGLTSDELKDFAIETGVEVAAYATGKFIGGGIKAFNPNAAITSSSSVFAQFINSGTNGVNSFVSDKLTQAGINKAVSYVAGQAAETTADAILSLGADYAIAQGQSYITTGDFIDAEDYWSMDKFSGEGKNQLIGILTGLASTKVNNYQQSGILNAQEKIIKGDYEGAKSELEATGFKMDNKGFENFKSAVYEAEAVKAQKLSNNQIIQLGKNDAEAYKIGSNSQIKIGSYVYKISDLMKGYPEGTYTIGREGDIAINDSLVSRQHLQVTKTSDGYIVRDLGSRNGTIIKNIEMPKLEQGKAMRLNGQSGEVKVRENSSICIGSKEYNISYLMKDYPEGTYTIGREGDIAINDSLVSRQHLQVTKTSDGYIVRDLGSKNGTVVKSLSNFDYVYSLKRMGYNVESVNLEATNGKYNDLYSNDLVKLYYGVINGKSVEDIFTPKYLTANEASSQIEIGDVCRVDGSDNAYIKLSNGKMKQLNISAETYLKLFQPGTRFASQQGNIGDCFLVSTLDKLFKTPETRYNLLKCFKENTDGSITVKVGKASYEFDSSLIDDYRIGYESQTILLGAQQGKNYNATGASGFKMLEDTFGAAYLNTKLKRAISRLKSLEPDSKEYAKKFEEVQKLQNSKNNGIDQNVYGRRYGGSIEDVLDAFDVNCKVLYNAEKFLSGIESGKYGNNCMFMAGSKGTNDTRFLNQGQQIAQGHAYSVTPVKTNDGVIIYLITNPWNCGEEIILTGEQMREYFNYFTITKR